jgi:broad specificity phosphatase PhoE
MAERAMEMQQLDVRREQQTMKPVAERLLLHLQTLPRCAETEL